MRDELTSLTLVSTIRISESYRFVVDNNSVINERAWKNKNGRYVRSMVTLLRIYYTRYARITCRISAARYPLPRHRYARDINSYASECTHTDVLSFLRRRIQPASIVDFVDENNRRKWGRNSDVIEDERNVLKIP